MYDPAADSWAAKNPMSTSRHSFATVACQNKIYVIGGATGNEPVHGDAINCSLNKVYDPLTDIWETKAPMPTSRSQIEANTADNKIYLVGGRTAGPYSSVNTTEVYDPASNSWTRAATMPYSVVSCASAVVDNKIYIIGGQDEFDSRMNLDSTQVYNPTTDTWTLGKPAPKRIYVIGGMAGFAEGLNQNYVYDPEADIWSNATPMPTARFNPVIAVVNDLLYVIWGGQAMDSLSTNEQYTPIEYDKLSSPSPSPSPSTSPTPSLSPSNSLLPTPSYSASEQPSPKPASQSAALPLEFVYVTAGAAVVIVAAVMLRRRK
jgi:N-acetylneuraminic acid mutarotase